ncbi:MAG: recombination protein RecR [Ignavibacteriales bacterium]|nr:MAG: recombination protein RecR [Ignavibacteriales bacterium]
MLIAEPLQKMIEEFAKFPGIGKKSAQRLAMYLFRSKDPDFQKFLDAVQSLKRDLHSCNICYNITEKEICSICSSEKRDKSVICVVEEAGDILHIERANEFRGVYHVLGGVLMPLKGIYKEELRIKELLERVMVGNVLEVILALNPDTEGDTTSLMLMKELENFPIKVTRLARGIPIGGDLEFSDDATIGRAMAGRITVK